MSIIAPPPSNFRFADHSKVLPVEGDVYNICERIKDEVSPNLTIHMGDDYDDKNFIVVETCEDGVERYVMSFDELDARIITKMQYLLNVPFAKRFAEAEKLEDKIKADEEERASDELFENFGLPMLKQLHDDGFSDAFQSFAKAGVITHGKYRK